MISLKIFFLSILLFKFCNSNTINCIPSNECTRHCNQVYNGGFVSFNDMYSGVLGICDTNFNCRCVHVPSNRILGY